MPYVLKCELTHPAVSYGARLSYGRIDCLGHGRPCIRSSIDGCELVEKGEDAVDNGGGLHLDLTEVFGL